MPQSRRPRMTLEAHIAAAQAAVTADGCWPWQGHVHRSGYGMYFSRRRPGQTSRAHRLIYIALVGPVDADLDLDHTCRNTVCVNPAHLDPVPHHVNVLRGEAPAAINARKTHCLRGHLLAGVNLRIRTADGSRICRTCRREANRRAKARKCGAQDTARCTT
jgi:hypothetical protein